MIGKFSIVILVCGIELVGIGNIVCCGNYECLLMIEWVYVDVELDEFICCVGNGELLFNGLELVLY